MTILPYGIGVVLGMYWHLVF